MNEESISPSTRWQALMGTLPFLTFGAASMIGKVDHSYNLRGHDAEMVVYFLALAGLLIGWIREFPLWSYGYLGWSLVLAWTNTNIRINGAEAYMLASTLVAAVATWFFLRSSNLRGRILAIVAGLLIAMIVDSICYATWDWYAYHGIPKKPTTWYKEVWDTIMILLFWGVVLFWPSIIGLIRRKTTRRTRSH